MQILLKVINDNKMNNAQRSLLVTALGAGIFIGASGLYIILRILQKIKRPSLAVNVDSVDLSIATLEELCFMKENSVLSSSRLSLKSSGSRSSRLWKNGYETDDEMYSALGSETDEYFDLTSDNEEYSIRSLKESKLPINHENTSNLFEEVDILLKGSDEDRLCALKMLQEEENHYYENPNFFWRMAKSYQMQATAFGAKNDKEKKKAYIWQGLAYAEKALTLDPSNPDAHKWYAILVGMQGEFLPVKDKIQSGFIFQKHLTVSLDGRPDDPTLYHLLGRFKYEIANLSWVEKKMASALFAQLPNFTMEDALADFKKAEELNINPWKENKLFVAKCYIGSGKYAEGCQWLNMTRDVDPVTHEDRVCDEECQSLLIKYQKYENRINKNF